LVKFFLLDTFRPALPIFLFEFSIAESKEMFVSESPCAVMRNQDLKYNQQTFLYEKVFSCDNTKSVENNPDDEEIANLLLDMRKADVEVTNFEEPENSFNASEPRKRRKMEYLTEEEENDPEYKPWAQNDEEEYPILEEEDDDWMDSGRLGLLSNGVSNVRIPRKKAPSGTACEKHKRWKKRCPEDCPMRKTKSKKTLSTPIATTPKRPKINPEMKSDSFSDDSGDFVNEDKSFYRKRALQLESSDSQDEYPIYQEGEDSDSSEKRRAGRRANATTVACERHTSLHARCPPHCADRRPVGARPKKSPEMEAFDNLIGLMRAEDMSPSYEDWDQSLSESDRVWISTYADQLPKSARIQQKKLQASETISVAAVPAELKKSPKVQRANPKGGRKYLPQACERHKMLHAKCPANCPDRLRRDATSPSRDFSTEPILTINLTPTAY